MIYTSGMTVQDQQSPLELWLARLSKEEMPAFAHTARSLASVSREDDSSANDLANVILHDSAMTARILRLANSVHFNVTGKPIETVSYAIVVLGFEQVRNMAITISMIDTVLDSVQKKKVQQEMICAYHAAVQAQRLAEQSDVKDLEVVYIGALLHRLGQIMFWCYPFDQGEVLLSRYDQGKSHEQVEREVLGFSLQELTSCLVSEWQLSVMLDEVLSGKRGRADEAMIAMGLDIADSARQGWQSQAFQEQLALVAVQIGASLADTREYIFEGARVANEGLHSFGFPQTNALLPPDETSVVHEEPQESKADLELTILRQLTHMLGEDVDLNKMLMAVLEGVYRVIEMDTVVFALVDKQTKSLRAKLMLGAQRDDVMDKKVSVVSDGTFLNYLHALTDPAWHKPGLRNYVGPPDPLISMLDNQEFFISPVNLNGRLLGAVYASRHKSKKPLTAANLQSFSHLCDHVSLAFRVLANR